MNSSFAPETVPSLSFPAKHIAILLCAFVLVVPLVIWNGTITAVDIKVLTARLIMLAVLALMAIDFAKNGVILLPGRAIPALFLVFAVYTTVVCLASPYGDPAILGDLCLSLVLFLAASVLLRSGALPVRYLLVCWQAAAALVAVYYLFQAAGLDFVVWRNTVLVPVGSTFTNRNLFAYFMICSYPYSGYLSMTGKGKTRALSGIAFGLMVAALLISPSRASTVILSLSLPAYLLFLKRRTSSTALRALTSWAIFAAVLAICATAVFFLYRAFRMSYNDIIQLTHGRLLLWKDTLRLIGDNVWFGHGTGSFTRVFPDFRSLKLGYVFDFFQPLPNSHNEFLDVLSENGVIGLSLFLACIACGTGLYWKVRNKVREHGDLFFFAGMSLSGCLVFSFIGEACHLFVCSAFSWISLAVCYMCCSGPLLRIQVSGVARRLLMAASLLWCAVCLWAGQYYGRTFLASYFVNQAMAHSRPPADFALASSDISKALAVQHGNIYALYQRGYISVANGRYSDAMKDYKRVRALDPGFENIHYNIGILYYLQKDYRNASKELCKCVMLYPTFINGVLYLAKAHYFSGEFKYARKWCVFLLSMYPGNREALELKGLVAQTMERSAPASP